MTAAMDRARRSPLRFLAPIGLVAFLFAFLLVVTSADDVSDGGDSNDANDKAQQRDLKGGDGGDRERRRERREDRLPDDVYVVKEGDTLASIAEKTGISVEELQELNPNLDPQTLVTGQEVRLRE
jgi:LysM domain